MHAYLWILWFAVCFGQQPCGISRTNCQGQSWTNPQWKPTKACILAPLMFVGTTYLLAATLWSSLVLFGRWTHFPAFCHLEDQQPIGKKSFHWKIFLVAVLAANRPPGLNSVCEHVFFICTWHTWVCVWSRYGEYPWYIFTARACMSNCIYVRYILLR